MKGLGEGKRIVVVSAAARTRHALAGVFTAVARAHTCTRADYLYMYLGCRCGCSGNSREGNPRRRGLL